MSNTIGHRGFMDLIAAEIGPSRKVRILSFPGRSDTGFIPHPQFRTGQNPLAIIDVGTGASAISSFITTITTGGISQSAASLNGKVFFALVGDTGVAGSY